MDETYIDPGPDGYKGAYLDELLALGFYRMNQRMFTTGRISPVFWLRTVLGKMITTRSLAKILQINRHFQVKVLEAEINEETERLFKLYRSKIDFDMSNNSLEFLGDGKDLHPFDSKMIQVRDGGRLIAVGYFDEGTDSVMGILNFYDPEYAKYSLGKFLILKKIDHARTRDMSYFYPGYINLADPKLDYKLFTGEDSMEVFLPLEKEWKEYRTIGKQRLEEYFFRQLSNFSQEWKTP
jgi:arginine-tRNA-protein transferase